MVFLALLPIFLLILLGNALKRTLIRDESVWTGIEKLTYYFFFPSLLITRLAASRFDGALVGDVGLIVLLALALLTLLVIFLRTFFADQPRSISSLYQGSVRFNTYIALACIDGVYGETGLLLAALFIAFYVPLVNAACVAAISLAVAAAEMQDTKQSSRTSLLRPTLVSVAKNPLVAACLIGIFLSFGEIELWPVLVNFLVILSQPALPLGLLAVGAGMQFSAVSEQSSLLMTALLNKLLLAPLLALVLSLGLDLNHAAAVIVVLMMALPAPPSSFILAKQLGGNAPLMANIVSMQTLAGFVMIPFWMAIAGRVFSQATF